MKHMNILKEIKFTHCFLVTVIVHFELDEDPSSLVPFQVNDPVGP